jgi:2-C-methyl-D-erythritol 4-phosphate cytidylyltransferase
MHATVIVPAAGRGVRMGGPRSKVLMPLSGRPLFAWTLQAVFEAGIFSEVLVACAPGDREAVGRILKEESRGDTRTRLLDGGQTRQDSVANCIREISADCDLLAIHDGARPLVTSQLLTDVLSRANETGAAIAAVPCKDTVKMCDDDGIVSSTLDRSHIWLVQTPQCFSRSLLASAYEQAYRDGIVATDDSALVERTGAPVHVVMGSYENIKVTTPEDLLVCEEILNRRQL